MDVGVAVSVDGVNIGDGIGVDIVVGGGVDVICVLATLQPCI